MLISAENKRKGGRVKLSGFYSANVYYSQCHVKMLFAQETICYGYTTALHPCHLVDFHAGIHSRDEIQLLTSPAPYQRGHFPHLKQFRSFIFGFCPSVVCLFCQ